MQFLKNIFKDNSVVGLCALKKKTEYIKINIPKHYKKTFIPYTEENYLLL